MEQSAPIAALEEAQKDNDLTIALELLVKMYSALDELSASEKFKTHAVTCRDQFMQLCAHIEAAEGIKKKVSRRETITVIRECFTNFSIPENNPEPRMRIRPGNASRVYNAQSEMAKADNIEDELLSKLNHDQKCNIVELRAFLESLVPVQEHVKSLLPRDRHEEKLPFLSVSSLTGKLSKLNYDNLVGVFVQLVDLAEAKHEKLQALSSDAKISKAEKAVCQYLEGVSGGAVLDWFAALQEQNPASAAIVLRARTNEKNRRTQRTEFGCQITVASRPTR